MRASELAGNAVTSSRIMDGRVNSADVTGGSLTAADLADNSVANAEIADDAVASAELANDSVGSAKLAPDTVLSSSNGQYSLTVNNDGTNLSGAGGTFVIGANQAYFYAYGNMTLISTDLLTVNGYDNATLRSELGSVNLASATTLDADARGKGHHRSGAVSRT